MANQPSAYADPRMQEQSTLGGHWKEGQEAMSRGLRQVDEMVQDHEAQAVLIALAAGFGVGLAIGCALAGSRATQKTDRNAAESIGRRILDNLEQILPEAISSRLNQMTT